MFYLKGIPIHFRKLHEGDLKSSYYTVMSLLSETNTNLINTLSMDELLNKLNDDNCIFVIHNLNTNDIIGTGTIIILNKGSQYSVCIIKEIFINKDYEKDKESYDELYIKFLKFLTEYCHHTEHCVKYVVNE